MRTIHSKGDELRFMRDSVKLSQVQVAKILGYRSAQFISNIENGRAGIPISKIPMFSVLYRTSELELLEFNLSIEKEKMERVLETKKLKFNQKQDLLAKLRKIRKDVHS